MKNKLVSLLNNQNLEKEKKIAVAVSGGIDSLALTLIANEWANKHKIKIVGITVDHCMRKSSAKEAEYVGKLLKSKGIEHHTLKLKTKVPEKNIEAILREKRYEALAGFCDENKISVMLVAHHLQDQAETFFIRLFRGSGIDGLASIKSHNKIKGIKIVRPFLDVDKETLRNYLVEQKIKWVEDESNVDVRYLRNKIRKFLDSFDDKADILKRIDFAIKEIAKARDIIAGKVEDVGKKVLKYDERGFYKIDLRKFRELDEDLAYRILANSVMKVSGNFYKPRLVKLKRIYEKILAGFKKETFYGCVLEYQKADEVFYVYREYSAIGNDVRLSESEEVVWDNRFKFPPRKGNAGKKITHIKKGEFGKFLDEIKKTDEQKYKEYKSLKGIEKEIFYTLPIEVKSKNKR